jgi:hypothetical protein
MSAACPICQSACSGSSIDYEDVDRYECPRCGDVRLGSYGKDLLQHLLRKRPAWFPDALSYAIRQLTEQRQFVVVTRELLSTLENLRLAPLIEQASNLILWVGRHLDDPAEPCLANIGEWASRIGARANADSVEYLLHYCAATGWIDPRYTAQTIGDSRFYVRLTFRG